MYSNRSISTIRSRRCLLYLLRESSEKFESNLWTMPIKLFSLHLNADVTVTVFSLFCMTSLSAARIVSNGSSDRSDIFLNKFFFKKRENVDFFFKFVTFQRKNNILNIFEMDVHQEGFWKYFSVQKKTIETNMNTRILDAKS